MEDLNLNRKLGPYHLERVLGRGGMGTVYAAREESTGESAAIKVLSPALASDESFRERFAAEIESLKQLKHPNIVELLAFGQDDGQLFYVMELVDGKSLQEELRCGRRFDWREVSRISIDICSALKHAHDHGIIHRDLKPANLLLTNDDQIKLFDFGIAKLFGATGVTTDSVMGTADYMSPEQGEGKPVGPRSDLYSLGSVMYALLAGKPPFSGKSIAEVVHKVRFEPAVPVGRLAADVPVEFEHLIDQLLEKDPSRRVPTALAVSHRLKAMEHALSVQLREEPAELKVEASDHDELANRPTVQLQGIRSQGNVEELRVTTGNSTSPVAGGSHFQRVEQEFTARTPIPWQGLSWLAVTGLVLVAAVMLVQKWRQPATADELYEQIAPFVQTDDDRELLESEAEVNRFLELYPDDARYAEVSDVGQRIEVERLRRRLDNRLRRGLSATSPLEQLYLGAVGQVDANPEEAARRLQAIVDVYGNDSTVSQADQQCIRLARRRLDELRQRLRIESQQHLERVQHQLDRAAVLATSDPDEARRIFQGILTLYANQAWAGGVTKQAQQALARLPGS